MPHPGQLRNRFQCIALVPGRGPRQKTPKPQMPRPEMTGNPAQCPKNYFTDFGTCSEHAHPRNVPRFTSPPHIVLTITSEPSWARKLGHRPASPLRATFGNVLRFTTPHGNKRLIARLQRSRSAPVSAGCSSRLNLQEDGRPASSVAGCTSAPGGHRSSPDRPRNQAGATDFHSAPLSTPVAPRSGTSGWVSSSKEPETGPHKIGSGPSCQRVPPASPPQSAVTKSPARRFCRTAQRTPRSAVARPRSALGNPRSAIVTLRSAP